MGKFQNLTGQKFGRLTVIERVKNIGRSIAWLCRCQCGNETIVIGDHLKSGHTKSCGCLQKERIIKRSTRHGLRWTRLYYIWAGMKQRCNNGESSRYKDYGARGIKICTEWEHNFQSFYVWSMVNGYQDGLTIDRIDVNEGYNPSNCRWANSIEQGRNKRNNVLISFKNKTYCLSRWSEILNINYKTLYNRIKNLHWTVDRAFTTPLRKPHE